jgi:tRNA (cytidine/uridine-2'-O-)-methyltransferase
MVNMRLVLYQPDIPQNTGALLRLAACFGVAVDLIEPAGFVLDDARLKRAALDYGGAVDLTRHVSWQDYKESQPAGRLIVLTTKAQTRLPDFPFAPDDRLLLGRESAGVPEDVHEAAATRLLIPLKPGQRSLNVAQAGAIALYEAMRQTGQLP